MKFKRKREEKKHKANEETTLQLSMTIKKPLMLDFLISGFKKFKINFEVDVV